jgi:beta-glucosidase
MATWFLGSQTGNAIADLVFGDHVPEGRLPVSFPQTSGQEPFYYDHRRTGRPQLTNDKAYKARYREVTDGALYPFGHGLGYAEASYSATRISASTMTRGGTLTVSATIANVGTRPLHEVAQLYIHDRVASVTQPVRVLRGVRHLDLAPGASGTVTFDLTEASLSYVHADLKDVADPGVFDVWIAPSAVGGTPASFTLA